jgi:hypothetical protein
VKKGEMGWAFNTNRMDVTAYRTLAGNPKEREHYGKQ